MTMSEETVNLSPGGAEAAPQQNFGVQRIYLKDASFETPLGVEAFTQEFQPKINLDLNTKNKRLDDQHFEVVLSLTINAVFGDGDNAKTAFLVEVQQAGIFVLDGFEPAQAHQTLGTVCPNILFPYAREAVDSFVTRGSFPALMLAPVNFESLYVSAMRQMVEQQQAQADA
jgi:preprotein translocase subunit SecB